MKNKFSNRFQIQKFFASENDNKNCSFFYKVGACRNETNCIKKHIIPNLSTTIIFKNFYKKEKILPIFLLSNNFEGYNENKFIEIIYEEIYLFFKNFGLITEIYICSNSGPHLSGNLYIKYLNEKMAKEALEKSKNFYFLGERIVGDYSPVLDFSEARCLQFENNCCIKNNNCNFIHNFKHSKNIADNLIISSKEKGIYEGDNIKKNETYLRHKIKQDNIKYLSDNERKFFIQNFQRKVRKFN